MEAALQTGMSVKPGKIFLNPARAVQRLGQVDGAGLEEVRSPFQELELFEDNKTEHHRRKSNHQTNSTE
jgi:hypothetical protein